MILEQDQFNKKDFYERIHKHQKELQKKDIDFSLIMYKSDLYYYSGTGQSCFLVIPADDEPVLFARRDLKRVREETALEQIMPITRSKEIYSKLSDKGFRVNSGKFGLEGDVLPFDMFQKFAQIFSEKEPVSIGYLLRLIRSIKSEKEITAIQKASEILDEVHKKVPELIKEGMTEIEVSGIIYSEMRKRGAEASVRTRDFYTEGGGNGLVLSGTNTGMRSFTLTANSGKGLHQSFPFGSSTKKIKKKELILIDLSCTYKGYIADETRCYVIGKPTEEMKERYRKQYEIEKFMVRLFEEGKKTSEVYTETYQKAEEMKVEKQLMGGKEIPFLAHGVGLELNDLPVITKRFEYKLKKGNVLAVEPKLIFGETMTIGSENTYAISKKEVKQLTNAPHQLLE